MEADPLERIAAAAEPEVADDRMPELRELDPDLAAANLGTALRQNLERITAKPLKELMQQRYKKFRKLGKFAEDETAKTSTPARQK